MKVVYFSQDYTPHDHRFLEALAGTTYEIHYLRLEDRGLGLESRPVPSGIDVVDWWGGTSLVTEDEFPQAVDEVRNALDRIKPDLVHAGPVQGPAYLTAMAGFRPLATMSWGSDLLRDTSSEQGRSAARVAISGSEVVVTDSQVVTDRAIQLGADPDRIVMFPWGVDLGRFHPGENKGLRKQFGWEDSLVLISTRSWEPIYGIEVLIQGFILAASEATDLRLMMLGSGSLEDVISADLREAGVDDRVWFPGRVSNEELPGYYRAADLYVTASRSDGSSISLLEAMASGVPALASDIPGNVEWIEPGGNGWLFEDGNPKDLAHHLSEAALSRTDLKPLGRRARGVAEKRADWSRNFAQLLRAYRMAVPEGI